MLKLIDTLETCFILPMVCEFDLFQRGLFIYRSKGSRCVQERLPVVVVCAIITRNNECVISLCFPLDRLKQQT